MIGITNEEVINAWNSYVRTKDYFVPELKRALISTSSIDAIRRDKVWFEGTDLWYKTVGPYAYIAYATKADKIFGAGNFKKVLEESIYQTVIVWMLYISAKTMTIEIYEDNYGSLTGEPRGQISAYVNSTFKSFVEQGKAYMYSEEAVKGSPLYYLDDIVQGVATIPEKWFKFDEGYIDLVLPEIRDKMVDAIPKNVEELPKRLGEEIARKCRASSIGDLVKLLFYGNGRTFYAPKGRGYILYGPIDKSQRIIMHDGYNGFGTVKDMYTAYEKLFFIPDGDLDFKFDGLQYEVVLMKKDKTIFDYCIETF